MGEVKEKIKLANSLQIYKQRGKKFDPTLLDYLVAQALVDTGCTMLVIPQDIIDKLELVQIRKAVVTYADERKEEKDVYGTVFVMIGDRTGNFDCVAGPPLSEPLIGQMVLEELDLMVDCKEQKLTVRPESPYLPLLKMK